MQVVESPVQVTVPALLKAVETLSEDDLDLFLAQARRIQQRNQDDSALLNVVNQGLPEEQAARLAELALGLEQESLTEEERNELLALVERAETIDVERAEALWTLAQRRHVTLSQSLKHQDSTK
ncbi:MAG: hypothetical protein R2844_04805 [Caldilineales bacterium]